MNLIDNPEHGLNTNFFIFSYMDRCNSDFSIYLAMYIAKVDGGVEMCVYVQYMHIAVS